MRSVELFAGAGGLVILLVVNEDEERVTQAVNLLTCALERTRGLRLADAGHFDVHSKLGEINAFGRTATRVAIAALKGNLKLVFKVSAHGLSIGHAEHARFCVLRFGPGEHGRFLLEERNGEQLGHEIN